MRNIYKEYKREQKEFKEKMQKEIEANKKIFLVIEEYQKYIEEREAKVLC